MKSLIRQVHNGVAEEQVKHQLETMLDEADYGDMFLIEVQLVRKGIPAEKIQELCDTHTRVLKKHLDLSETPKTVPGHPINILVKENRELTKTTGLGLPWKIGASPQHRMLCTSDSCRFKYSELCLYINRPPGLFVLSH